MQARQDPAVARRVEQREREALVAAGLLERVVADQSDPLEGPTLRRLERSPSGRASSSRPSRDRVDLLEVRVGTASRLAAVRRRASGPRQPGVEPPTRRRRSTTTATTSTTTATVRPTTMAPRVRLDERVEVDRRVLRGSGGAESSRGPLSGGSIWPGCYPLPSAADRRQRACARGRPMNQWRPVQQTMAKRSRGSTSRPGQRPPLQRQAPRPRDPHRQPRTVVARPAGR